MKKGDRVVLSDHEADASSPFWKIRGIDCSSVGTVFSVQCVPLPSSTVFVEVQWDNGSNCVCDSIYFELYKSKNISLPNREFQKLKMRTLCK